MSTIALISMFKDAVAAPRSAGEATGTADVLGLFTLYGSALYRFCRFTLGVEADAEDVVQDTFLKLVVHLGHQGDRTNLKAWLFAVAANGCRDRLRLRRRWLPWPERGGDPAVLPDETAPDRRVAAEAFRKLAPRDRLLLALRAQGLSYREIAAASGIRQQSVGRLLARATDRWKLSYRGRS